MRVPWRWAAIPVAIVLSFGMWRYIHVVVLPVQRAKLAMEERFHSDLYPRWLGARELLLHGRDPYSAEVTAQIQQDMYGRELDPRNPADRLDQQRFAYPLYVIFLLAPAVILPFRWVQLSYGLIIVVVSAASVGLWAYALGLRMKGQAFAAGIVLMLGSWPVLHGLYWQQPTMLVAAMLAGAVAAIAAGALWVAGVLLALALIKPQLALPAAGWLVLWAVSNWRERKALPLSFATVMCCMWVGAEILSPGWFWRWCDAVSAYSQYARATTPVVQILFGKYLGGLLWVTVLLTVLAFCWEVRRNPADTDSFKLACVCVIGSTLVLTPSPLWFLYDQVLVLPAVLLGILWRNEFFRLGAVRRVAVAISTCAVVSPWIAALTLWVLALVSPSLAQTAVTPSTFTFILLPLAVLLGVVLLGGQRMRSNQRETKRQDRLRL